jgi:hypothetical protein
MFVQFVSALGTMKERMREAARYWRDASVEEKDAYRKIAEEIPRPTVESLDDAGRKKYIRDQLTQVHSIVSKHVHKIRLCTYR